MRKIAHGVVIAGFVFLAQQYMGLAGNTHPLGASFQVGPFDSAAACNFAADALVNGEIMSPNTLNTHYAAGLCVNLFNGAPQPNTSSQPQS